MQLPKPAPMTTAVGQALVSVELEAPDWLWSPGSEGIMYFIIL